MSAASLTTLRKGVLLALALLASSACGRREPAHPIHPEPDERGRAYVGRDAPPEPLLEVSLLAFRVADDDGVRPARITAEHIVRSVAFANAVFRPAGVRFRFDPRALRPLQSSRVNDLVGTQQDGWLEAKRAADEVADLHPDQLVVFFRHGPGAHATGGGFSATDYNFVVMPGWLDDWHCGHEHLSALAHELGHHLGLHHTFGRVFEGAEEAAAFLQARAGDITAFDGDGLLDTAPDPGIRSTECLDYGEVELSGVRVPLERRNVMSYYDQPDSLTAEQIQRLRWFLRERLAHRMKLPKNQPRAALEAERLELAGQSGGRCSLQEMDGFGAGNWSGGKQLFCGSHGRRLTVRLTLPVERSGLQRIELYATRAPDFGVFQVYLDAAPLGAYDAWAPAVLASGAILLGERQLEAGSHEITFVVQAKNPASGAFHLGIDAIALIPSEPLS